MFSHKSSPIQPFGVSRTFQGFLEVLGFLGCGGGGVSGF